MRRSASGVEVFDMVRLRWVALTPEEWVRQNFVAYLTDHLGYPVALIGNEISLVQNGIKRRCDTLVADREGKPLMIIEYKSPLVALSQSVVDQVVRYNTVLRADFLTISNGLEHYCYHIDYAAGTSQLLPSVPRYDELK